MGWGFFCLVEPEVRLLNWFERKILIPHYMQYIVQYIEYSHRNEKKCILKPYEVMNFYDIILILYNDLQELRQFQ